MHSLFDPPSPPPPPVSPTPLTPPFLAVGGNISFAGCTDACDVPDTELLCRDGGKGSFLPALCAYGSQCSRCGVRIDRETIGSTVTLLRSVEQLVEGDNSCPYAYDGLCQDGRASTPEKPTEFVFIDPQTSTHLCGYLTDMYMRPNVSNPSALRTPPLDEPAVCVCAHRDDCGSGTISSLDASSFSHLPRPPLPRPPPPPPPLPPSPAPPFVSCRTDCADDGIWPAPDGTDPDLRFCSDGGLNSLAVGFDPGTFEPIFKCDIGTQCTVTEADVNTNSHLCEFRLRDSTLCSDSCLPNSITGGVKWVGSSRNGVCEDGGDPDSLTYTGTYTATQYENEKRYVTVAGCGYGTQRASTLFSPS